MSKMFGATAIAIAALALAMQLSATTVGKAITHIEMGPHAGVTAAALQHAA